MSSLLSSSSGTQRTSDTRSTSNGRLLIQHRKGLEKALSYTNDLYTFEDVVEQVEAGKLHILEFRHSIVVYGIDQHPRGRVLNVFLATGNLPDMSFLEAGLVKIARIYGCKRISLTGRRGWARSFLTYAGWHESPLVTLEREIYGEEGQHDHQHSRD